MSNSLGEGVKRHEEAGLEAGVVGSAQLRRFRPPVAIPGSSEGVELDRFAGKPRWWRDQLRRRMLSVADFVVALAVGISVTAITGDALAWSLVPLMPGLLAAKLLGLYDADHRAIRHLTVDELPTIAVWTGITVVSATLVMPGRLPGITFMLVLVGATMASFALRSLARWSWRKATPPERTLVIGDGEPAEAIRRKIELFDDMHLELDRVEDLGVRSGATDSETVGHLNLALARVDRVVLAWTNADPMFIERMLELCRRFEVKLSVISPFRGRARPAPTLSQVADLPVLEYNTWDVPRSTMVLKRCLDLVAAACVLLLLSPLFVGAALAIKIGDRGPVLFRQRRAGKNGRPFTMFKFRSMTDDAESRLGEFVLLDELDSPMFKLRSDPRVTRVGKILRRFSIDELPQLINVLRGEMSLVGPRPEEIAVVERYEPQHLFRLDLRPGLTGPMQVLGRGELTFSERLAVDMDYLETLSVGRDLRLIALTVPVVIRGNGAF